MSCKDITSQAELDGALVDDGVTCVHIKSADGVWLELRDNHGRDVEAYGSATVSAYGSATVSASGSATVRAYGSATVSASGSATVSAYGSATVRASDSATVRAYGSATVRASSHVAVHLHHASATVAGGVVIDVSDLNLEDTATWLDHHGVEVVDGRAVLYKALTDDLIAGRDYDRPTTYTVGAELVAEDWRDNHYCGGGLHLSPDPVHAAEYCYNASRYMRCTAAVEDIRPITEGGAPKCKVRALVVAAEVDVHARDLAVSTLDGGQ